MATASFQTKVEDYVGTFSDTSALTEWLTSGARYIIDLLPDHILDEYATTVSVTTSGLAMANYRIQKYLKNGYKAPVVNTGLLTAVQDSNSIHYALNASPVTIIYNGKVYIYPNGGEVLAMAYPSVAYSQITISDFPVRMIHGVILYTAIQVAISKAYSAMIDIDDYTPPTPPDQDLPEFTYTSPSQTTIDLSSITAPTYTKPTSDFSATNLSSYVNSSTTEDLDQATAEGMHQKTLLEKFQMDLYNELNEVNAELKEYESLIQVAIEEARLEQQAALHNADMDLEAQLRGWVNLWQGYQYEVQAYAAWVSAAVSSVQGYLPLIDKLKAEFNEFMAGSIRSNG